MSVACVVLANILAHANEHLVFFPAIISFLPYRASFFTTFLNNCGGGESLGTTTCPKTVVVLSKGMLHVKYFHSNKASFFHKISCSL